MRSCEEMELLMNLYMDDMLPSEEARPLKEHLNECQACRERFQQLSAIKEALGALEEPVPEGLHGRILDYVEKNGAESAPTVSAEPEIIRPRRWLRTLTTVAACAVLAVAAIRFVPDLALMTADEVSQTDVFYQVNMEAETAAPPAASVMPEAPAAPPAEILPDNSQQPALKNELLTLPPAPQPNEVPAGPLAEDLPPQHREEHSSEEELTVRKWLKAEGSMEQLPDWAEDQLKQFTDEDGNVYSYAVIDQWNEDYWKDQLTPCGFVFSDLEGEHLTADGEKILVFFRWTE